MTTSESIKNIATALATFHSEVGKVAKTETNPFYHSKYASLPNILDAIKEPLAKAKLVVSQFHDADSTLTTLLVHTESGEWMQSTSTMMLAKNDPQGAGSAITYYRRYDLGAILNLNVAEDYDGNAASKAAKPKRTETTRTHTLTPYESAARAIEETMTVEELDTVLVQVAGSKKLDEDDKAKLLKQGEEHREAIHSLTVS